jgi:hypothetical protein
MVKLENEITETIHIAVAVCQRNTERTRPGTEKDSEQLWFKLLDALVVPLRKLRAKQNRRAMVTPVCQVSQVRVCESVIYLMAT